MNTPMLILVDVITGFTDRHDISSKQTKTTIINLSCIQEFFGNNVEGEDEATIATLLNGETLVIDLPLLEFMNRLGKKGVKMANLIKGGENG